MADARVEAEMEYRSAESKNDAVGTTVWGRVNEQARKLTLLYAVSENHADCLRLIRKLQEIPERQLPHSLLLNRIKMDAKSFQEMIATLEQQGDIATSIVETSGRPHRLYRLIRSM